VLIVMVGLYTGWLGWQGIEHGHDTSAGTAVSQLYG
jgi:nickel/cobalt exporter